jgi:hypothetical protein
MLTSIPALLLRFESSSSNPGLLYMLLFVLLFFCSNVLFKLLSTNSY